MSPLWSVKADHAWVIIIREPDDNNKATTDQENDRVRGKLLTIDANSHRPAA
jgi:hypothetical protein